MSIPSIPIIPLATATQRISPTDISQYIRLDQCRRYLRLRFHERSHGLRFMQAYDVTPQSIPPILTLSGERFENRVEQQAAAHIGAAIHCADAALKGEDAFIGEHHNTVVLAHALDLAPGARLLLFQPRLQVPIGSWDLRGNVDLLLLQRIDAADDVGNYVYVCIHHDRRRSVSDSVRRIKSPSLTIPNSSPRSLTTGTALMRRRRRISATCRTLASGSTVTTFVVITSAAFITNTPLKRSTARFY